MNSVLYSITIKNNKLDIIYDKREYGLYSYFSSDDRMSDYIYNSTEEAFQQALNNEGENLYVLNIASTENLGYFEWRKAENLLKRQMGIFNPIIQMFIIRAVTEKL